MKELRFATEEEALQHLADVTGKNIKVAGSVAGPGIPDGTGPMSDTEKCPIKNADDENDDEAESVEGEEVYLKEQLIDEDQKLVIEKEGDMFETELYRKKEDKWIPVQAVYFEEYEKAEEAFEEMLDDLN